MVNTRHKLLTVISFTFFGSLYAPESQEQFCLEDIPEEIIVKELVEEKDLLLEAMIQVESRGIEDQIGDRHLGRPSVGVLQIRPIMVREINRILKKRNELIDHLIDKKIDIFIGIDSPSLNLGISSIKI